MSPAEAHTLLIHDAYHEDDQEEDDHDHDDDEDDDEDYMTTAMIWTMLIFLSISVGCV